MPSIEGIPGESSPVGKDILLSLLQKSFGTSLTYLETRADEQMNSLRYTSKTFSDFDANLQYLTKQVEEAEKLKKEKEKEKEKDKEKDKGLNRSHTVGKLSTKKTTTSAKNNKANLSFHSSLPAGSKKANGKPLSKTVNPFKADEDTGEKKKTLVKSKTAKSLKSKKNDLTEDKSLLNQSSSSTKKKTGSIKKKSVKESIKNISIKKEVEKSEKEDIKTETKDEKPKEEPKKEEKPIERKPVEYYIKTYSGEKWFDIIYSFLNSKDKLYLSSSTKAFKSQYLSIIKSYETSIIETIELSEGQTVDDKINEFKQKYKTSEEENKEYPEFQMTKGAIRAIELLNNEKYNQLFKKNILDPKLNEIIVIYRLLFRLLNQHEICQIEDDSEFWIKVCDYFNEKGVEKLGTYLVEAAKTFCFDDRNVYLISKLLVNKKTKMIPSHYSKICSSTGLIMFLIKDSLEYCGILFSEKKTPHNRVINTLLYEKGLLEKIKSIKEFLEKL